mmetsp:Transcript_2040/g.3271  ORF Transcript_2040/g.3271 Transcript_2040/m.3271 type:complete len:256 (-) Transcript_2040:23-790(-)
MAVCTMASAAPSWYWESGRFKQSCAMGTQSRTVDRLEAARAAMTYSLVIMEDPAVASHDENSSSSSLSNSLAAFRVSSSYFFSSLIKDALTSNGFDIALLFWLFVLDLFFPPLFFLIAAVFPIPIPMPRLGSAANASSVVVVAVLPLLVVVVNDLVEIAEAAGPATNAWTLKWFQNTAHTTATLKAKKSREGSPRITIEEAIVRLVAAEDKVFTCLSLATIMYQVRDQVDDCCCCWWWGVVGGGVKIRRWYNFVW